MSPTTLVRGLCEYRRPLSRFVRARQSSVQLFMKGHVALENLKGGINNQMSVSIVSDRLPVHRSLWAMVCCAAALPAVTGQVAQMRPLPL